MILLSYLKRLFYKDKVSPSIPYHIQAVAKLYPVLSHIEDNEATGNIEKFNFVESCKGESRIGQQVLSSGYEGDQWYDYIWVHVGQDYFKCIMKCKYYGIS